MKTAKFCDSHLLICLVFSLAVHGLFVLLWQGARGGTKTSRSLMVSLRQAAAAPGTVPLQLPEAAKSLPVQHEKVTRIVPATLPAQPPTSPNPAVQDEAAEKNLAGGLVDGRAATESGDALPPVSGGSSDLPALGEEALTRESIPLYSDNPKPEYPRLALERGWEGEVLLQVRVGTAGNVLQTEIKRSSGYPVLDRAAMRGVQQWRFEPGRRGNIAIESTVLVPIPFILERN